MCHFQTLRFPVIVRYGIHFNFYMYYLKGHKVRSRGPYVVRRPQYKKRCASALRVYCIVRTLAVAAEIGSCLRDYS